MHIEENDIYSLWVFRLSLGEPGNPKSLFECAKIDEEVKRYKKEVSPLDDYSEVDMGTLKKELKNGRLRQGWGLKFNDMDLNLRQSQDKWIENYRKLCYKVWGSNVSCSMAVGRWKILSKLLEMKKGDIIFIPRIPDYSTFTVATVKKKYDFKELKGFIDHGHVIEIEDEINEFDYGRSTLQPKIFLPYRKAVNRIRSRKKFKKFLEQNYY